VDESGVTHDQNSPYAPAKQEKKFITLYVVKFDSEVTKREKAMDVG